MKLTLESYILLIYHLQSVFQIDDVAIDPHITTPIILDRSPDNGAFLVTQPIPKCGAFCYLAVVSRPAR